MPVLRRSPFPAPLDAAAVSLTAGDARSPRTRQLELFTPLELPAEGIDAEGIDAEGIDRRPTRGASRWTVVESDLESRHGDSCGAEHRSREGQLSQPRHERPRLRAEASLSTQTPFAEGSASCGRASEATGSEASSTTLRDRAVPQPIAPAADVVRTLALGSAKKAHRAVYARRATAIAPVLPTPSAKSARSTRVETREERGGVGIVQPREWTAAASYGFVAVLIVCTFLV